MRANGMAEASMKGAQDFPTEADGATETFLRERLAIHFTREDVLGEEQDGAVDLAGLLRVPDPIDGTANFARGGTAGACPWAWC